MIVPVYNVEQYLRRCIDSIIAQTYKELEIILIDDGSTDSSSEICDEYSNLDQRIKVIHKKNGGLASARNSGLEICKGDFIGFVDSDDWILPKMYESMMQAIGVSNSEIAVCGFYEIDEEGTIVSEKKPENREFDSVDLLKTYFDRSGNIFPTMWTKLFGAKLFSDIRFPDCRSCEDISIIHRLMGISRKTVSLSECYYMYFIRSGSLDRQWYNEELIRMTLYYTKDIVEYTNEHYAELNAYARGYAGANIYLTISTAITKGQHKYYKKDIRQLLDCMKEYFKKEQTICGLDDRRLRNLKLMLSNFTLYRLGLNFIYMIHSNSKQVKLAAFSMKFYLFISGAFHFFADRIRHRTGSKGGD